MRFKVQPEDFVVEELAQLPLTSVGDFAIYRVEKQNTTTLQVQTHIAAQLKRRPQDVQTPALKDKTATTIQHLSLAGTGPEGRIVAEDVERAAATPAHATVGAAPLEAEVVPLTSIRRTIARRLTQAWEAPAFQIFANTLVSKSSGSRSSMYSCV